MNEHKITNNDPKLREVKPGDFLVFNDHELHLKNIYVVTKIENNGIQYMSLFDSSENIRDFVNFEDGSWTLVLIPNFMRKKINLPNREEC